MSSKYHSSIKLNISIQKSPKLPKLTVSIAFFFNFRTNYSTKLVTK